MRANAILPQFSAFVSASAGSGKTKTLIDRLLNLLLSSVIPSKILCLAFTKAAAAEILARIIQKLEHFAIAPDDILRHELRDLGFIDISSELMLKARILFAEFLDETEPLNIQTIHSFCQQLLTKFPLEAGINLNFSLLTDNKIINLIDQSKNTLLNSIDDYLGASDALRYISWHMKEYSLRELLFEIIMNREKLDNFFEKYQSLDDATQDSPDEKLFITNFIADIPFDADSINPLFNAAITDRKRANKLIQYFNLSIEMKIMMIDDYLRCFLTLEGEGVKTVATKAIRDNFGELHNQLTDEVQRAYQFNKALKLIKAQRMTNSFIVLSYYIRQIYANLKKQNNYLDYDDLIKLTKNLLASSEHAEWIRYKLDGGIDHVLVDEAQDTSFIQWQIINKISEEFFYESETLRSIFIVGDAKQSIFSFQGAEPELFNAMNYHMPEEVVRVSLSKSFRSGRAILKFVDKIFNQTHIKPLVTGIEPVIEHIAHKDYEGEVELWPLVLDSELEEDKPWALPSDFIDQEQLTGEEKLAKQIAAYIRSGLDDGNIRDPGDVLILTRRRTKFVNHLITALREANVPVTGLDRLKLMSHPAILDLVSLINFVALPKDDLNLAILLKSPIYGMSEEQLMHLCYNREASLWQALEDKALFEELLILAKEKSIFEFFFYLLEYKDIRIRFIQIFGMEVNDVLDSFLDLITQFEAENIPSMQLFLNFLNSNKTEVKRDLSHSSGQVRVMTVHGAKGLQAPIVILADTTSLPINSDKIIWLDDDEPLYPGREKYYPDIAIEAMAKKRAQEYAEYLRLLYVAVTRAESKLIICGSARKEEVSERSWYGVVSATQLI